LYDIHLAIRLQLSASTFNHGYSITHVAPQGDEGAMLLLNRTILCTGDMPPRWLRRARESIRQAQSVSVL